MADSSDILVSGLLPSGGGGIAADSADTLTNKTIDGDNNTISDIAVSSLKEGTDGELITWGADGEPTTVSVGTANQVLTSNGAGAAPTFQDLDVAVSELATGTDGELITWDASGNPTTVAVGTSGQILTSNGAGAEPTFQTPSFITDSSTDTLTNKTFDANGTGNSLSNVDVADLADGTDGELITWDAAGSPATVSTGTSGQVLTSNGAGAAPTFQDVAAGGGAWNLISTQTASASSTIDFTSSIDSTYDTYALVFNRVIPATDDVTLQFRTGNTTFDTGANYAWSGSRVHSSGSSTNNTADNQFNINIDGGIGNASGEQMSGIMYIFDPSNSGSYPPVRWESTHINNVGVTTMTSGSGSYLSNTAIDRFRFFFSSGNIASGSFSLYGISHT